MDKVIKRANNITIKPKSKNIANNSLKSSNSNHKKEFILKGLGCANCAGKMEREISKIEGVKAAAVDFARAKLFLEIDNPSNEEAIIEKVNRIVKKIEPEVMLINTSKDEKNEQGLDNEGNKGKIINLAVGAVIFAAAAAFKLPNIIEFILYLISYLLIGGEVIPSPTKINLPLVDFTLSNNSSFSTF